MWRMPLTRRSSHAHARSHARTLLAAPGKFESKRFCFDNKVIIPWHVTFMPISVVLSRKEPYHADSQTALSRWRSPYLRYLRETDERGADLSPCPSRA